MKLIQPATPILESMLWDLQKHFYNEQGPKAWSERKVPNSITSNCYMADTYASIIAAFFRDLAHAGWTEPPIILEIGGGSGILAWQIIHRLLNHQLANEENVPSFNYLLTDGAELNIANWKTKKRFDPFRKSGLLDFGTLWVGETLKIQTEDSGLLTIDDLANRPVILISNYLYCTIPCDLYRINHNQVYRDLVAIYERDPASVKDEAGPFERITTEFSSEKRKPPYTGHPGIDAIIDRYRELPGNSCVPVPELSIRFLENFLKRDMPFLNLAADLGFTEPTGFRQKAPFILKHYLAYYTNFHMMGEIVKDYGGTIQFPAFPDYHLSTVAFMRSGPVGKLDETMRVAKTKLYDFTPYDAFNVMKTFPTQTSTVSYHKAVSWLRFGRFDPTIARACIPHLIKEFKQGGALNINRIRDMYLESYKAFFPDGSDDDFDMDIARFFILLGLNKEALTLLERGAAELGKTIQRRHIMAIALKSLDNKFAKGVHTQAKFEPAHAQL